MAIFKRVCRISLIHHRKKQLATICNRKLFDLFTTQHRNIIYYIITLLLYHIINAPIRFNIICNLYVYFNILAGASSLSVRFIHRRTKKNIHAEHLSIKRAHKVKGIPALYTTKRLIRTHNAKNESNRHNIDPRSVRC